ncbi:MAG: DNA polymerase III subunit beta [Eubacteriales bacterium]|nr:DNA polymerase III subunit beta [Eubacteriales bacterium]
MKFNCEKSDLYTGLNDVSRALSSRASYQLLECVVIKTLENEVELTCSDGNFYIRTTVEAEIEQEGSLAVDTRLFKNIVQHFPEGRLNIASDEKMLITISGSGSRSTIAGQSDIDYPAMRTLFNAPKIHVPQNVLKTMINRVVFAIATGEVREILNGGFLEIFKDEMRLVGLDGYRLSIQEYDDHFVLPDGKEFLSCIVPGKTLQEISGMLSDKNEHITIHIDSSNIMFVIDKNIVVSQLYGGNYVKYRNLVPEKWETRAVVKRDELLGATERAGLIAKTENTNIIKLEFKKNKLYVTSKSDLGEVFEEIDIELDGVEMEIAFNGKYLLDILKNLEDGYCELLMKGMLTPCIIKNRDKNMSTYMLMSVRY